MNKGAMLDTGAKARFAMAVHCHQPVYNFGWELERSYELAYEPLVRKLEEYPAVRMTLHFTGNLLEWFAEERPEYLERLKALYAKGQVEFLGGGCYEPLLPLIPNNDRLGQLEMNARMVRSLLGVDCSGIWLAERLWVPELINTLAASGAKYTIVDDQHLLNAGVDPSGIYRPFRVRTAQNELILFPALTDLRYSIPFRSPSVACEYMRRRLDKSERDLCFFFADDGEKFGSWPHTYRHVYERGWLDGFFGLLTRSGDWLECCTYSELLAFADAQAVDVPGGSYPEMMKWSGGDFGNFAGKYPEAGRMLNRMLSVSDMLEDRRREYGHDDDIRGVLEEATRELYRSQAGCAYWHGAFAGIYQPHLRKGVYEHLVKAERDLRDVTEMTGTLSSSPVISEERALMELSVGTPDLKVFFSDTGGSVTEIDLVSRAYNLTNVMARRRERYHANLNGPLLWKVSRARRAVKRGERADIHDILGVSERGLKRYLHYDDHRRCSFMTHLMDPGMRWGMFQKAACGEKDFLEGVYKRDVRCDGAGAEIEFTRKGLMFESLSNPLEVRVRKRLRIPAVGSDIMFRQDLEVLSNDTVSFFWAVELNLAVFDEDLSRAPWKADTSSFSLRDKWTGLELECSFDGCYTVYCYPVYTVNQTEKGLKKTLQGTCVLFGRKENWTPSNGPVVADMTMRIR